MRQTSNQKESLWEPIAGGQLFQLLKGKLYVTFFMIYVAIV